MGNLIINDECPAPDIFDSPVLYSLGRAHMNMDQKNATVDGYVKSSIAAKTTNGKSAMEDVMTDYSELMVLILMLPVVIQIIIPLLMLAAFSLGSAVTAALRRKKSTADLKNSINVEEQLQLSGS